MGRLLIPVLLSAVLAASGCARQRSRVTRDAKAHLQEVMAIVARLPPTPPNQKLLGEQLAQYRTTHRDALALLRSDSAKLARSDDPQDRLAARLYCNLDRLLTLHQRGKAASALFAKAKRPADALQGLRASADTSIEACMKALANAK